MVKISMYKTVSLYSTGLVAGASRYGFVTFSLLGSIIRKIRDTANKFSIKNIDRIDV